MNTMQESKRGGFVRFEFQCSTSISVCRRMKCNNFISVWGPDTPQGEDRLVHPQLNVLWQIMVTPRELWPPILSICQRVRSRTRLCDCFCI
ncbi:hypothetical protein K1719_023181 [Acacia pycnantha]|nr:hypothetical protein K1719_023181 [Acacia pycnantha]